MLRLLKRFRWPITCGLATLLIMAYLLLPRPSAEYRLPSSSASVKISPSGKLLALYEDTGIHIYRMPDMKLLLTHRCFTGITLDFDSNNALVFYTYSSSDLPPDGASLQLWHWQQGQTKPRQVASRKPFPPEYLHGSVMHHGSESFNGLYDLDTHTFTHCILSSDARKWLIPVTDGTSIRYELVDTQTGISVQLDIPPIEIKNPSIGNVVAAFSVDGKELVVDCAFAVKKDQDHQASRLIRWFDVQTGKMLQSKTLDYDGPLLLIQKDRIAGVNRMSTELILKLQTDASGLQSISMSETEANPVKRHWPNPTDAIWVALPNCECKLDGSKRFLIYCWEHDLFPTEPGSGFPPTLPGYYYGVRELSSGKLIHSERLPDRPRQPNDWKREGWSLLAILSDAVLMLEQSNQEPPPWRLKWEEWRQMYIPWCPSLPIGSLRLLFIEATTGKRFSELLLPYTQVEHCFNKQQQLLYLIGHTNEDLVLQVYHYPLHKPWLLIWSWALGVAVSITILVEALRWFRRRRKA